LAGRILPFYPDRRDECPVLEIKRPQMDTFLGGLFLAGFDKSLIITALANFYILARFLLNVYNDGHFAASRERKNDL